MSLFFGEEEVSAHFFWSKLFLLNVECFVFFLSKQLILSKFLTNAFLPTGLEGNTFEPLERSLNDSW